MTGSSTARAPNQPDPASPSLSGAPAQDGGVARTTRPRVGEPLDRVDGRVKVTGAACYAAEFGAEALLYGHVASSSIAKGRIASIDASAALAAPGVVQVFTHHNRPRASRLDRSYRDEIAPPGSPFRPLADDHIRYSGQPIALVVAETSQAARYAVTQLAVRYDEDSDHATSLAAARANAFAPKPRDGIPRPPQPRGDADAAFAQAAIKVDAEYRQAVEHHNAMELFATTVVYQQDGSLVVHDKTQGAPNTHGYVTSVFGLDAGRVRVVAPFVGGAFGSGLRPQYQLFLAVMAALALKRSVRVVLTRQQMFTLGYRPGTIQRVRLGASSEGVLQSVRHEAVSETSRFEDFSENIVNWSGLLYQCDNVTLAHDVVALDRYTPIDMRAPGAASGLWALESAFDELAVAAAVDPVELRLRNYAERDQMADKPFSSNALRECYAQGAAAFGWAKRTPKPRSMQQGRKLVGWGMASGVWEALYVPVGAKATLSADGRLEVGSATADIGPGTTTAMTQVAADALGVPMEDVHFSLGDSSLPKAMVEGGSATAASVGSAVLEVCTSLRAKLIDLARKLDASPFKGAARDALRVVDGRVVRDRDDSATMTLSQVMHAAQLATLEEATTSKQRYAKESVELSRHTCNTHSAVFAEVRVDEDFGTIEVMRVVSAVAAGRILNPKTARSQILGGIVGGIGMALLEETMEDHAFGRFVNRNLAEYHVPVNADVRALDVIFVDEPDAVVNPLGVKGVGEIGLVAVAAAIANAVHHATGVRVRELPITLDKLLARA